VNGHKMTCDLFVTLVCNNEGVALGWANGWAFGRRKTGKNASWDRAAIVPPYTEN
jgi:hypothetical protein